MVQLSLFSSSVTPPFRQTDAGVELYVKVTPKASQDRVGDLTQDRNSRPCLRVYVSAPPENNRANEAVIELVAKTLKIGKNQVHLVSGDKCREKTLLITNLSVEKFHIFRH
jgi:uncharacterized protein (TIGR00251 family)